MSKIFSVKVDSKLTAEQRGSIVKSVRAAVGDDKAKVIVSDDLTEVSAASPYQLTERVGNCSRTMGFPTLAEMRRFSHRDKPGMWYDFDAGESNDPRWSQNLRMRFFDAENGIEFFNVIFYHSGTLHLERMALDDDGIVFRDGHYFVITETRKLRVEFPSQPSKLPKIVGF